MLSVHAAAVNRRPLRRRTDGGRTRGNSGAGPSARARLDAIKASLADPDAVTAAGSAPTILRNITRMMPTLTTRRDSVEATYYAIEANLMLDRPDEACRLLKGVQAKARGSAFEGPIDRFLTNPDLGCSAR